MLNKYYRISDKSLDSLRGHQLYCNHYESFNDPFECWGMEVRAFPDPEKERARFVAAIDAWGFTKDRLEEALVHYDDYVSSLEGRQPPVETALADARITCFSSGSKNLLMWAHYGDGLRGFCIEFDETRLMQSSAYRPYLFDVRYSHTPPIIDTAIYAIALDQYEWNTYEESRPEDAAIAAKMMEEIYQKLLASKPIQWEYEQERRLIVNVPQGHPKVGVPYVYDPAAIKSIVVGERIDDLHRKELEQIVHKLGLRVSLRTAKRSRSKYEVEIA